jgi:hypothetical protein
METVMVDWLTWPADLLLDAGGIVAGWFISKDATSFIAVQMMVATLVLAAIISLLVFLQTLWSRRKAQTRGGSAAT